ncbi:MAG: hypothetical protein U5N55_08730 [Cypionkella sp.]|nr:hypothetical protein [Cypionkella sp.]
MLTHKRRCYVDHAWHKVPLIDRAALLSGQTVNGPAILTEPTGTNFVAPGWQAEALPDGSASVLAGLLGTGTARGNVGRQVESSHVGGVQQSLHVDYARPDGCHACQHGPFGQHQGTL